MNELLNRAVRSAGELIMQHGGFDPFGVGLTEDGRLAHLGNRTTEDREEDAEAEAVRDAVHEALRAGVEEGTYRAVCAVSDGGATEEDGADLDAVIIRLEHRSHEPMLLALPYFRQGEEWAFGELARAPYDAPLFFAVEA